MRFGILHDLWALSDEKELDIMAAGMAFYGFMALFPSAAALIAIAGVFADASYIRQELLLAKAYLPPEAYGLILQQVDSLLALNSGDLTLATTISVVIALWSARAGVAALMRALNAIHGLPNRAGHWHQLRAILLTFVMVGLALAGMILGVIGPVALGFLPLGASATLALEAGQIILSLGIVAIGMALMYRLGLNREVYHPLFTRGVFVALVIWVAASRGFVLYLNNFDAYNRIYGSIGAVVALLIWLYLSGYAMLLGTAVDAARARKKKRPNSQ
jgi:membrane protein